MSDTLLISAQYGQIRAMLLRGGQVVAVRAAPLLPTWLNGQTCDVQVTARSPGGDGAFVTLPDGQPGYLTPIKGRDWPVGHRGLATVITPARPGKQVRLRPAAEDATVTPPANTDWLAVLHSQMPNVAVIVDHHSLLPAAQRLWAEVRIDHGAAPLFHAHGVADAYWDSLSPHHPVPGGGAVHWMPTPAGHSFDVDSGSGRPGHTNPQAASVSADLIFKMGLEGLIYIGFIPLPAPQRPALRTKLRHALMAHGIAARVGTIDDLGGLSLSIPRHGLALDEVRLAPLASGLGYGRRAQDVAVEIHEAVQVARHLNPGEIPRVRVHPALMTHLGSDGLGADGPYDPDPALHPDRFEVTYVS